MPVQKSEKNKKSCILTESGREKLKKALAKDPNGSNISELALSSGKDRAVISKILNQIYNSQECKAVNYTSLYDLFSYLKIDLEDDDFNNPEKTPKQRRPEKPQISRQDDKPVINIHHQVAELLCLLDCTEQEEKFKNTIRCHKWSPTIERFSRNCRNWIFKK